MHGREAEVTPALLEAVVADYATADPAPVVVGHPETDAPAYGWVERLRVSGDRLQARLSDLAPEFREAVEAGRYGPRSIALQGDRLRHVAFLGGRAPAVPGLTPTRFSAPADRGIVLAQADLASDSEIWGWSTVARMMRGIREWIVEQSGVERADAAIPDYEIRTILKAVAVEEAAFAAAGGGTECGGTKINADTIQSDPFEPGRRGWRIERDSRAESNEVVILRQLQVDSVSLGLAALQVPRTAQPAIAASWIVETSADLRLGRREQHLSRHGRPRQHLRHCQRGRPARCPLRRSGHRPAAHHLERTPGAAPETRPVDPEGHRRPSDDGRDLADRLEALPGHLTASPGPRFTGRNRPENRPILHTGRNAPNLQAIHEYFCPDSSLFSPAYTDLRDRPPSAYPGSDAGPRPLL